MKNNIVLFLILVGLIGLTAGCEKDGEKIIMSDNVIAPTLVSLPDLTLERVNATDSVEFVGTPVDPGFDASATYFLEACPADNNFEDVTLVYSGVQVNSIKMTVSDLNGKLLDGFPPDQTSSIDFRIRCNLVVDAGTGAPGTGSNPLEYTSDALTKDATIYGLPRLNLINSGIDQYIESILGDGVYSGFVKFAIASPYTLEDPDLGTVYGGSAGILEVDGDPIVPPADGWHILDVDVNTLTYSEDAYMIGIIGSAVPPYDWSVDIDMDYNFITKSWYITLDMEAAEFKFRLNDGWAWNLGLADGSNVNLVHDGANIPVPSAGNWTVTLYVSDYDNELATFEMVKNN